MSMVAREQIQRLMEIAPGRIRVGQEIGVDYAHDEMTIYGKAMPEVLLLPESTQEVSDLLAYLYECNIAVTPRGAGTGLCGGCVPMQGGVLLSLERMNQILEIDKANMTLTCEPGVLLMDIYTAVEAQGLFYPPDPGEKTATIGGNVMTNAGGMRAIKYGVTRDYVLGMEVVMMDGKVMTLGSKVGKTSSGYSLLQLMVGSEGTLGIVTRLVLKLLPLPKHLCTLLVPFAQAEDCMKASETLVGYGPVAIEFMQREVIMLSEEYLGKPFPDQGASVYLLLRFDAEEQNTLVQLCERVADACLAMGAIDVFWADSIDRQARLWTARGAFLEAIKGSTTDMDECDVVLPRALMPAYITFCQGLSKRIGLRVLSFGHAGDGNLHVYLCKDDQEEIVWQRQLTLGMQELYQEANRLGGQVSGEHGIGHAKREFLRDSVGDTQMELMKQIKLVFDPKGLMNPGKVILG